MIFTELLFSGLVGFSFASVLPGSQSNALNFERRAPPRHPVDPFCFNSPSSRECWGFGFSIDTDSETQWPFTGRTVSYDLEITNITLAPDGTPRRMLAVNGQYPGPTISANWGDILQITVKNNMQDNGQVPYEAVFADLRLTSPSRTSMHWHGISQVHSNNMDGVNGITECPLPPGYSKTYRFLCTQHGTSWYHSHYSAQYGDGIQGPIVIYGPATANYDIDLGAMPISDLYYQSIYVEALLAAERGPPTADNGVINGTMVNPAGTGGAYNKVTLRPKKTYRLRLINTSVDNHFKVSLDSHNLTVIAADFVPIVPYDTQWLFIGIGERYDVIITANQPIGNYWFRAEVQQGCGQNANEGNIKAIFSYVGAAPSNPNSTATIYTQSCNDETNLVPYVAKNVPENQFVYPEAEELTIGGPSIVDGLFVWNVNNSAIDVDWEKPTLQYVLEGNTSYPADLNLYQLPKPNVWAFFIIQAVGGPGGGPPPGAPPPPAVRRRQGPPGGPGGPGGGGGIPHPIHLHGHDFYVLGAGSGNFSNTTQLQFTNPPRRDVAMLPGGGWLVIGFLTDNPGAWLMHCHIAWHVGEGFAVQFLERVSEIKYTFSLSTLEPTCREWDNWYKTSYYKKDDSGL